MRLSKIIVLYILIIMLLVTTLNYSNATVYSDEKLAISLVIDTSYSMLSNDPNLLRLKVIEAFIDNLRDDDYLGIITFNSDIDLIIPMQRVGSVSNRNDIKNLTDNSMVDRRDTDYTIALTEGKKQLDSIDDIGYNKVIVFLTDGKPDPSPVNMPMGSSSFSNYIKSLFEMVDTIGKSGYRINSIGFSSDIDEDILREISSRTNGDFNIYEDINDLNDRLISTLNSRESLVEKVIISSTQVLDSFLIDSNFSFREDGYRFGEGTTISASIKSGINVMKSTDRFTIDEFQLVLYLDSGETRILELNDDGIQEKGDLRENDGIWSAKLNFNEYINASGSLKVTGKYSDFNFQLQKYVGLLKVSKPGEIIISNIEENLVTVDNGMIQIKFNVNNTGDFSETIFFSSSMGQVLSSRKVFPKDFNQEVTLDIKLPDGMEIGEQVIEVIITPNNFYTVVKPQSFDLVVNVESFYNRLVDNYERNKELYIVILCVILFIIILLTLMPVILRKYLILKGLRIKGRLYYWKDKEQVKFIDINTIEKTNIQIGGNMDANIRLEGKSQGYLLIIQSRFENEGLKYKSLFKAFKNPERYIKKEVIATPPGIINSDGRITTIIQLHDGIDFVSGDYTFKFEFLGKNNKDKSGVNLLEGRFSNEHFN